MPALMASLLFSPPSPLSIPRNPLLISPFRTRQPNVSLPKFTAKDQQEQSNPKPPPSSIAVVPDDTSDGKKSMGEDDEEDPGERTQEQQQEVDWKEDEEFKRFMGNPSIEAAIKLEKKRADRKLRELDGEASGNTVVGLFRRLVRESMAREKERLEKAEETFKALDLNKVAMKLHVLSLSQFFLSENGWE